VPEKKNEYPSGIGTAEQYCKTSDTTLRHIMKFIIEL